MKTKSSFSIIGFFALLGVSTSCYSTILYDQDFENPAAFVNDGGDVNIVNSINTLYGNQPPGFLFGQTNTVETLLLTGTQAFGHGYSDPAGTGGNYALGMLATAENDFLGLSFDVGTFEFLNVSMDLSSIDLSVFGGPFVPPGAIPVFEFTLFDNPSGGVGVGSGTILDSVQASATASARDTFEWTRALMPLAATGNTNGNVTLRIDLLAGGYASLDNLFIEASDTPVGVPEPSILSLFAVLLSGIGFSSRRFRKFIEEKT